MNGPSPRTPHGSSTVPDTLHDRQPSRRLRTIGVVLAATLTMTAAAACDRSSGSPTANPTQNADAKQVTLAIASNAISGGKNADEADWITNYVIPKFTEQEKAKGNNVKVTLPAHRRRRRAVQDEARPRPQDRRRRRHHLDRRHLGRRVRPGRLHQAARPGGRAGVTSWDGLGPDPQGRAGNVWPSTARRTASRPAPTAGCSSTTRSSSPRPACPPTGSRRAGTTSSPPAAAQDAERRDAAPAQRRHRDGRGHHHAGRAAAARRHRRRDLRGRQVAGRHPAGAGRPRLLQDSSTATGLGDPASAGRQGPRRVVPAFAEDKIGILLEGDYFWRSVINPKDGDRPDGDRDKDVGYALIPAQAPGKGLGGTDDFVSMSGGSG